MNDELMIEKLKNAGITSEKMKNTGIWHYIID